MLRCNPDDVGRCALTSTSILSAMLQLERCCSIYMSDCARAGRSRAFRESRNRTMEEARGIYIALYRRRLGCFVAREFARHRLRRIPFIGLTRDQVRARRRRRDLPVLARDTAAGVRAADYYAYSHAVAPAR